MENNTATKRRGRPSKACTEYQTGNAVQETKAGIECGDSIHWEMMPAGVKPRYIGDMLVHAKQIDDAGKVCYWVNLVSKDLEGNSHYYTLRTKIALSSKLSGVMKLGGKTHVRVTSGFLSVSIADDMPVLVILSGKILNDETATN